VKVEDRCSLLWRSTIRAEHRRFCAITLQAPGKRHDGVFSNGFPRLDQALRILVAAAARIPPPSFSSEAKGFKEMIDRQRLRFVT